jgi:hypothetical protein
MSNTSTGSHLTRLIEFVLRSIFKKFPPTKHQKHTRYIHIDDVMLCARLSVYYQEVMLAKYHSSKLKALRKSLCIQADQELKRLLIQTPELVNFVLKTGDPGKYLLKTKFIEMPTASEIPSDCIAMEINDLEFLFTTVTRYSFYSRRKKNMQAEFAVAENNMRKMVEQFHLPGNFSWNFGTAQKINFDFMDEYGSIPPSSQGLIGDVNNQDLAEVTENENMTI